MKSGVDAFQKFVSRKPAPRGGTPPPGGYLNYFILADGEQKIVRFLTDPDDMLVDITFYEFVLTSTGKYANFVVAPDFYADDPTWRGEDWVLKYGGKVKPYGSNTFEDPQRRQRTIALVVEREEVVETDPSGKRRVTRTDKLSQFEGRDGRTYNSRNFMVVKPTSNTFWPTLVNYHEAFGTLCDRDYLIKRIGTGRDINYSIIPKDPDPGWENDGSSLAELQARYGYKTGLDVDGNEITSESPDRYLYWTQSLREWAESQASEERARSLLCPDDDRPSPPPSNGAGWSQAAADEPVAVAAPSADDELASLRARLERHR